MNQYEPASAPQRIGLAEIGQETDSFSPLIADLSDFEANGLFHGDEILVRMRGVGALGGLLEVAASQPRPVELLPIVRAWGAAGGTISADTLRQLEEWLYSGLRRLLPVDAVFLALHGAAAAETDDDVEGRLLERVRDIVGPAVPVVVAFDHHANITRRMVAHANLLIGHETQPHDPVATGRKAARLLFDLLAGKIDPVRAWRKIPLITPQDQFLTSQGPMREWFDLAREMEARPGVLDVSPYPMQPWLDAAEGGWAVVTHTNGDPGLAGRLAEESAALAWRLRDRFWESARVPMNEAVRQAVAEPGGIVLLSDTGDSVYGGSTGDGTGILRELLQQALPGPAYVPLVDAEAVAAAQRTGVGGWLTLDLGAKVDRVFNVPVRLTARVAAVSRGTTVELPERGVCELGSTALLEIGAVRVVVLDRRSFAINHPILYTHLGLDPGDAWAVVLKTASNFQFFSHWRRNLIRVDTPGPTQSELRRFDWRRIPRPIYPLDPVSE